MRAAIWAQSAELRRLLADPGPARAAAGKLRGRPVRLVGIGTSWHAAQHGAWLLAEAGVDARAEHAADLAPYGRGFADGEAVIVLSHTGSTGYSAEMLRRARGTGGPAVGISAIGAGGDVTVSGSVVVTGGFVVNTTWTIVQRTAGVITGTITQVWTSPGVSGQATVSGTIDSISKTASAD